MKNRKKSDHIIRSTNIKHPLNLLIKNQLCYQIKPLKKFVWCEIVKCEIVKNWLGWGITNRGSTVNNYLYIYYIFIIYIYYTRIIRVCT